MKKVLLQFLIVLISISMLSVFALAGCKEAAPAEEEAVVVEETPAEEEVAVEEEVAEEEITIGVLMPQSYAARWRIEEQVIKETIEGLGGKIVSEFANDDVKLQTNQLENMITKGVKVIIITAVDPSGAAQLVKMAKDAGIPVVAHARMIPNADLDFVTQRDSVEVGEIHAELALQVFPKGNYVLINGDQGDLVASEKRQGYYNILQPSIDKGDIKIVSDQFTKGWSTDEALKQTENALTATNNEIVAILTNYDGLALGAIRALEPEGLVGEVFITGEDAELYACQNIVEGKQTVTCWNELTVWASESAKGAWALANGQTLVYDIEINNGFKDVPAKLVTNVAVTKDNMYDIIIKSGFQELEEVYANIPKDQWPKEQ